MTLERSANDMFETMRADLREIIRKTPSPDEERKTKHLFKPATLPTLYALQDTMKCELEILYRGNSVIFLGAKDSDLIAFQLQKSNDRLVLMAGVHAMSGVPWQTIENETAVANWIQGSLNQPHIKASTLNKGTHII